MLQTCRLIIVERLEAFSNRMAKAIPILLRRGFKSYPFQIQRLVPIGIKDLEQKLAIGNEGATSSTLSISSNLK